MRLRFSFLVKNRGALLPFHHQYLITGLLKKILGDEKGTYPHMSFSGVKGQTRLGRNGLHYNSRKVTIIFSSLNHEYMQELSAAIMAQKELSVGSLHLMPETVEEEKARPLDSEIKYVCLSPVTFDNGDENQFLDPASNDFSDIMYESTVSRMEQFGVNVSEIENIQRFQIVPDPEYIQKLSENGKKYSRMYSVKSHGVVHEPRGYTMPFTMFAAPEVQEFIFYCGLGAYTNYGFGLVDFSDAEKYKSIDKVED